MSGFPLVFKAGQPDCTGSAEVCPLFIFYYDDGGYKWRCLNVPSQHCSIVTQETIVWASAESTPVVEGRRLGTLWTAMRFTPRPGRTVKYICKSDLARKPAEDNYTYWSDWFCSLCWPDLSLIDFSETLKSRALQIIFHMISVRVVNPAHLTETSRVALMRSFW